MTQPTAFQDADQVSQNPVVGNPVEASESIPRLSASNEQKGQKHASTLRSDGKPSWKEADVNSFAQTIKALSASATSLAESPYQAHLDPKSAEFRAKDWA